MASQFQAITGLKRKRPGYVNAINAKVPYLAELYGKRSDAEYRDKLFGLQEQGLESDIAFQEEDLALRKKQGTASSVIGAAGLATNIHFARKLNAASDTLTAGESVPGLSETGNFSDPDIGTFRSNVSGMTNLGRLKNAGVGGLAGTIAGPVVGETVGNALGVGGKKDRRFWGGAAVGGATSYFTGGDIYSIVAGALLGGAGARGGFF